MDYRYSYCLWPCLGWFLAGKGALRYSVGTDICFDDWCATVDSLQQVFLTSHDSAAYDLVITTSNHTRGIAQRPSEPRVHLIDDQGRNWPPIALVPFLLMPDVNSVDQRLLL
jgi:hypothetical protein